MEDDLNDDGDVLNESLHNLKVKYYFLLSFNVSNVLNCLLSFYNIRGCKPYSQYGFFVLLYSLKISELMAIPFNIGTPPIEGSGYPMGEGGCIVKFSKGVTQRIFLKKAKIFFVSKGGGGNYIQRGLVRYPIG